MAQMTYEMEIFVIQVWLAIEYYVETCSNFAKLKKMCSFGQTHIS